MRMIEGESGQFYQTVRMPDGQKKYADKMLVNENDWQFYFEVSEAAIATHFGEEGHQWFKRMIGYVDEDFIKRETVASILGEIFHHMEESGI